MLRKLIILLVAGALAANCQQPATPAPAAPTAAPAPAGDPNAILLTVFLRHDQTKNVDQINEIVGKNGFRDNFPPKGIEVASWYVMMGIGQVVTLKVPPSRLREVNRTIESGAWGGYHTEFYPTYELRAATATPTVDPAKSILLTIFLRHDQTKNSTQINEIVGKNGFRENFPPKGIDVISWYTMMGIGQVVTLRVPPDRLRDVNRSIETGAWGGFRTEFYTTYDYKSLWQESWPSAKAK